MTANEDNETNLRDLESEVRTELALAEQADQEPDRDAVPDDERPPDPDGERYEIRLRSLLGAVSALER
jgi:hypothetical protein